MKATNYLSHLSGLILTLMLFACHKSATDQTPAGQDVADSTQLVYKPDTVTTSTTPFPQNVVSGCSYAPSYGDSIVYPQPATSKDYIISPINNPGAGKYLSWPQGMVIDSVTGAIDVTKSETGMKYAIGFVKSGSRDTCLNTLIIGGTSYVDSIYVLNKGAADAVPYFDANPAVPSPCEDGNGNGCSFAVSSYAWLNKVSIDKKTGVIDLNKTLNGSGGSFGAFGPIPWNGETFTATITYQLKDKSNKSTQSINLQFVYYYSRSQVPASLQARIALQYDNLLTGSLLSTDINPRPPLVVIVRGL